MLTPALVVVGYNRLLPLQRLLSSLERAQYPEGQVPLVISVDHSEDSSLRDFVRDYRWPHGPLELILHKESLGLRAHVLSCGDLSQRFSSVIVLEDDLYVSPYFYLYAQEAKKFYDHEGSVAGVALYSHSFNETCGLRFDPISDGSDVFFMQTACSWGQLWTASQWAGFRKWLSEGGESKLESLLGVPPNVRAWPKSSWKKLMTAYLVDQEKFVAYPRCSLTTNFSDPGTNYNFVEKHLQVPLESAHRSWHFLNLESSIARYDAYCEILPESLRRLNPEVFSEAQSIEVDLYGAKPLALAPKSFWLTSKGVGGSLKRFALDLKPHELNVRINGQSGPVSFAECSQIKSEASALDPYERLHFYFGISKDAFVTREGFEHVQRQYEESKAELAALKQSTVWRLYRKVSSLLP